MVVSDSDRSNSQAWIYDLNSDPVKAFSVVHPSKGPVFASIRSPHLERYVGQWAANGEVGWLLTDGQVWEFSEATTESSADSVIMVSDYQLVKIIAPNQHRLITFYPQVTSVAEEVPLLRTPDHPAVRAHESFAWQHELVNAEVTVWDVNGRQRAGAVQETSDGTSRVQIGDRGLFLLRASTGKSTRTQVLLVY